MYLLNHNRLEDITARPKSSPLSLGVEAGTYKMYKYIYTTFISRENTHCDSETHRLT